MLWPHYYDTGKSLFYRNKFGKTNIREKFLYATGELNFYSKIESHSDNGILWQAENYKISENIYPVFFNEPYYAFFIRNCHKNYTINSGTKKSFLMYLIALCIKKKKHLIIFQDLFTLDLPKNEYIHSISLEKNLDLDKFIYYTYNVSAFIANPGSITDIYVLNSGKADIFLTKNISREHPLWTSAMKIYQYKKNKRLGYTNPNNADDRIFYDLIL